MIDSTLFFKTYLILILVGYFGYFFYLFKKINRTKIQEDWKVIWIDTFICLTLILFSLTLYEGIYSKSYILDNFEGSTVQFIGTILAVFFSLSILPIQNIIQNTSFSITNRLLKNKVFIHSIILLVLIFLLVSIQKLFGFTLLVNQVHYIYLTISVITFFAILYEVIRLLDIRNVIFDTETEAIGNLNLKWKNITSQTTDLKKQTELMLLIKAALIIDTENLIEPIFVTTKKYIVLDQYEVVIKGLAAITNITSQYIELFKFSVQDNDRLLIYIIERFKDLRDAFSKTTHYSIMPTLVSSARILSVKSLDIQTPLSQYHQSYLQLGLVNYLKEIVLSAELLKDTSSAPIDAVYAIEEIGVVAASKKNFNISRTSLEALSEISVTCTKANFPYSNAVAKEANRSIMVLNYHMLKNLDNFRYLGNTLAESITKPVRAFMEVGIDHPQRDNLSPIIGTGIDPAHLFDWYSMRSFLTLPTLVFYGIDRGDIKVDLMIEYLEELFQEINQILMAADDKELFFLTNEIVETTYSICFTLLQFLENKKMKLQDKKLVQDLLDDRISYIFSNAISGAFSQDERHFFEKIEPWVTVIGIYIVVFQSWEGFSGKSVDKLLEIAHKWLPKAKIMHEGKEFLDYGVINDLEEIYKYLGLCLYWEFSLIKDSDLRRRILNFIFSNKELFRQRLDRDEYLPTSHMSYMGSWSIEQPLTPYYPAVRDDFAIYLSVYDPTSYNFRVFIKFWELKWKLIQLLKFVTKEVSFYESLE